MAGGQMMDLVADMQDFDLATVSRLQALKTGALISFSTQAGAILGEAPMAARAALDGYAAAVGLAFQIADDLLDIEGDAALAGKALHKDAQAGKATFVSLLGIEAARTRAQDLVSEAIDWLTDFGEKADLLRQIARFTLERDR
jgi:farnesyl diphosphate synthase